MEYKLYDTTDARLFELLTKKTSEFPFIKTVEHEGLFLNDVLKLDNKVYRVYRVSHKNKYGELSVKEIKTFDLDNVESNYESEITCPICGYQEQDSWEYRSDCDEYDCGCCGAVLEYNREVTVEYRTTVKEKPEVKEI